MTNSFMQRLSAAVNVLLGRLPAGREATVLEDDVFIVSYPRSGNTWFRFLVANMRSASEPASFLNIERLVPDIYKNSDHSLLRSERPRLLKSHEPFDARYKRVIYLVRDPRDVAVSYYHYFVKQRAFGDDYPIGRFVDDFVAGRLDTFGSWGENVASWCAAREGDPDFIIIRYEDLLADPIRELRRVAPVIAVSSDEATLDRAVRLSDADRMRDLERTQGKKWATTKDSRRDKPFVRAATTESWRNDLTPEAASRIEQRWHGWMTRFGFTGDR